MCIYLPMLFQLAPRAVSDMLREAQATDDDDTVSGKEIFTDGSSLIPRAWPRGMATSGGWGGEFTISALPSLECSLGEVTVDAGHQFFCGADSVHIGACEVQAVLAALAWCHVAKLEFKDVKIRPDSKYAIGVLDRSHRCISHVRLVQQEKSLVSPSSTQRLTTVNGK